jgi:hypothetical protein
MTISWFMPWWGLDVPKLGIHDGVVIYPYGVHLSLGPYAYLVRGELLPGFFAAFVWAYFGICIAVLLYSLWVKDKELRVSGRDIKLSSLIIGLVGASYVICVVTAAIIMAIRTGDFGVHLLGVSLLGPADSQWEVYSGFRIGYWLACGVGPLCIALALLRDKIIGKLS